MGEQLELYDVTIVGGGPAGMYAAFYSGMRDLKTKLIEFNPQLGGKILIYPEKMIWDVGGVEPMTGESLIARLERQARTFEPTVVLGQRIVGLERLEDGTFLLGAASGEKHHTRTVVLAVGHGIPVTRKLELEGADRYEVDNLHYTVTDIAAFRGKRVLISGGGDSAVDWANELEPIAAGVTVVHRRDRFGGLEKQVAKMKQSSVTVRTPFELVSLHGAESRIREVTIAHAETGATERLPVDAVIVNHGMKGDLGPMKEWGLAMNDGMLAVSEKMETNIPGIYGAGDFVTHSGKVKLMAGAFVDGVHALNSAKLYLDPTAPKIAYVSSHNEKFKEKNKALGVEM